MLVMMLLEFFGAQRLTSTQLKFYEKVILNNADKEELFTCATKIHEMVINLILLLYDRSLHQASLRGLPAF